MSIKNFQIDASALLALIRGETGSELVEARITDCVIHTVNLAEVYRVMIRNGVSADDARLTLGELLIPVETELTEEQGIAIAQICCDHPFLSIGDAVCITHARWTGRKALTAEKSWRGLEPVELIR